MPADLFATLVGAALTRGVLDLKVSDSNCAFALRRWLENGGLAAIKAARPGVRSVMVHG